MYPNYESDFYIFTLTFIVSIWIFLNTGEDFLSFSFQNAKPANTPGEEFNLVCLQAFRVNQRFLWIHNEKSVDISRA